MIETRFFTKTNFEGKHIKLMVLIVDHKKEEIYEYKFIDGKPVETSEVMQSIILGSTNIDEITKREAMKFYPDIEIDKILKDHNNA